MRSNRVKMAEHEECKAPSSVHTSANQCDRINIVQCGEGKHQQSMDGHATHQAFPSKTCVPQLVTMQAAATPDAVALVDGDQVLSYGELNARANQLAHFLLAQGVHSNTLVGLCVERSLDMVVGLLGILKAGGTYLPLDPSYPQERLTFMLEDAQVAVLVTQQHFLTRYHVQKAHFVCLDTDAPILVQQPTTDPVITTTIDDLAYIIYTSGSTGQPKGVQVTHGGLLNLVCWHQHAFNITASDRATQVTSPAFDATGWELWPYLTIGASVYLVDDDLRVTPTLLREWLLRHGITITFLPTALAENVMTLEWPAKTALRFLLTGADTLHRYPSPDLPFALINNYGPTEATVVATSGQAFPTKHADMPPSIGRPIANTQIYILDEHLQPVSTGTPGELYIGGAGLARGYLNRPELTDQKFIPHPFCDEPGARLYRTGDLARYLPDGQIAFMGRVDHQIKIRGYRIEPGEIAAVLNEHPAVQASYILAREDTAGDKCLVAYIVLVPETKVAVHSLQETLQARLPDYMIPATFVSLDAFPLTPNGKVDRDALPAPSSANTLRDNIFALPNTPIEEQLVAMVAALLGLEQVGVDENFFMLGGHSLLGTQIIARVADTFGVDLSLRILFEASTIRHLAKKIEQLVYARVETMSDDEVLQLLEQRNNAS
jgi:amino acid adenylation domain-containing protein